VFFKNFKIKLLFIDVLDNDTIILKDATTAADIEDWDSLSHIMLIAEIEKKFKIKFSSLEITKLNNVGELVSTISSKIIS
jgi:acyl carrier protein